MLLLTSADVLRVTTNATCEVDVNCSYVDLVLATGVATPGRDANLDILTATTTTIVSSPAAGTVRNIKQISINNEHASTSVNVIVDHFDGTYAGRKIRSTLLAGECLLMCDDGEWHYLDATGAIKPGIYPAATQAEMEAATSLLSFVTPGMMKYHP